MRAETERQYFTVTAQRTGGGTTALVAAVAGKIPVITRVTFVIIAVAAGQTVAIQDTSGTIVAHIAPWDTLNSYPMTPLFAGVRFGSGSAINFVGSGGAGTAFVSVEGYFDS